MTRNSLTAWQAISEASWIISRVRMSRSLSASTSSKAKLSKRSMSSGSVWASVDARSGNSSSWLRRAVSVLAIVSSSCSGGRVGREVGGGVLLVGDWFEPGGGVAGGGLVEDRVMAHHVLRGAVVPVLFPGRGPDRLP